MLFRAFCLKSTTVALTAIAILAIGQTLQAGTLSIVDLPSTGTDAASGISSSNAYTHTVDTYKFGNGGGSPTINGVKFTSVALSGTYQYPDYINNTLKFSYSDIGDESNDNLYRIGSDYHNVNASHIGADGYMYNILRGGWYVIQKDSSHFPMEGELKLWGLTAGTTYSLRLYYRPLFVSGEGDHTGPNLLTFNGDGADTSVTVETNPTDGSAYAKYIQYDYKASSDTVTVTIETTTSSPEYFHLFAFTNEVVVPEPGTLTLLAAGLVGLLCYAWRKRK